MQKILFNDRFGLTQAVIEGRKTMTRRILSGYPMSPGDRIEDASYSAGAISVIANRGESLFELKSRYKVGEVVAVAQSYKNAGCDPFLVQSIFIREIEIDCLLCELGGWKNKMFTRADLMPHQIRITAIRCERLQDISDEDCLKEGVIGDYIGFYVPGIKYRNWEKESHVDTEDWKTWKLFPTPRAAFAALIDKVSGRGTWERNPWVVVYEFELVK